MNVEGKYLYNYNNTYAIAWKNKNLNCHIKWNVTVTCNQLSLKLIRIVDEIFSVYMIQYLGRNDSQKLLASSTVTFD